jgi:hypothetical protein
MEREISVSVTDRVALPRSRLQVNDELNMTGIFGAGTCCFFIQAAIWQASVPA